MDFCSIRQFRGLWMRQWHTIWTWISTAKSRVQERRYHEVADSCRENSGDVDRCSWRYGGYQDGTCSVPCVKLIARLARPKGLTSNGEPSGSSALTIKRLPRSRMFGWTRAKWNTSSGRVTWSGHNRCPDNYGMQLTVWFSRKGGYM